MKRLTCEVPFCTNQATELLRGKPSGMKGEAGRSAFGFCPRHAVEYQRLGYKPTT